jgi:hypothetical protein
MIAVYTSRTFKEAFAHRMFFSSALMRDSKQQGSGARLKTTNKMIVNL